MSQLEYDVDNIVNELRDMRAAVEDMEKRLDALNREKEEASLPTYKEGDVFTFNGGTYLLAQAMANNCCVIGLNGNRYQDPVNVKGGSRNVTLDEVYRMFGLVRKKKGDYRVSYVGPIKGFRCDV